MEKEKSFNEIDTPVGHLISAPLDMGEMPCQMDVKIIERVIGKCERRGGSEACIAGSYVIPNHHDCIMNR
ncbi:unnamed protein product [Nezara viridula]|uniref:Uncharacterized protein n=1 Tax=Nezara viridula TaxID=85310 RepID=A0A9P0H5T4_NEZVI|nr:unnamed protein product [Nezara viridula]